MEAKAIVDRAWDAMESDDFDAFEQLIHPDAFEFQGAGAEVSTAAEMRAFVEAYKEGFPDLGHEVLDHIESGETVALELRVTGTHQGDAARPPGRHPCDGTRGRLGVGRLRQGARRQGRELARPQGPARRS